MIRRSGVLVLTVIMLSCMISCAPGAESAQLRGARAAARTYVEAIMQLDVETADAMSAEEAFEYQEPDLDVRAALPAAVDPITDPWIEYTGSRDGSHVFTVSYALGELTGGDTIELEATGDPSEPGSWQVVDPLIAQTYVHAQQSQASVIFGERRVRANETVWGYPAGYRVQPSDVPDGFAAEPLWIGLGVADTAPWDDSLPMVEVRATDRLTKIIKADLRDQLKACVRTDRVDSEACAALPVPFVEAMSLDAYDIASGRFENFGADDPTVELDPDRSADWVDVTAEFEYLVQDGRERDTGASADGQRLSITVDEHVNVTVADGEYQLAWE